MTHPRGPEDKVLHDPGANAIRVQLLHVSACQLVEDLRSVLDRCLSVGGWNIAAEEVEGPYPSPTLLINGRGAALTHPPKQRSSPR
jgi:hypothetical protein